MDVLEQNVWQRVVGDQRLQAETDLKHMALDTVEAMSQYSRLLRSHSGKEREVLKQLLDNAGEDFACLKGLYRLQNGSSMKLRTSPTGQSVTTKDLICRYHKTRRAQQEYTARSAEPDWGCVFHDLAQRQEKQCSLLARLLGRMGG